MYLWKHLVGICILINMHLEDSICSLLHKSSYSQGAALMMWVGINDSYCDRSQYIDTYFKDSTKPLTFKAKCEIHHPLPLQTRLLLLLEESAHQQLVCILPALF